MERIKQIITKEITYKTRLFLERSLYFFILLQFFIFPFIYLIPTSELKKYEEESKKQIGELTALYNKNTKITFELGPEVKKSAAFQNLVNQHLSYNIEISSPSIYLIEYADMAKNPVGYINISSETYNTFLVLCQKADNTACYIETKVPDLLGFPLKYRIKIIQAQGGDYFLRADFDEVISKDLNVSDSDNSLIEIRHQIREIFDLLIKLKNNSDFTNEDNHLFQNNDIKAKDNFKIPLYLFFDPSKISDLSSRRKVRIFVNFIVKANEVEYKRETFFDINLIPIIETKPYLNLDKWIKCFVRYINPIYIKEFSRKLLIKEAGKNKLRIAKNIFYALQSYGLEYTFSSSSLSAYNQTIQPPHLTLKMKKGQCTDLTALFASLLLSFNIDVKLVLFTNHTMILFKPDKIDNEYRRYIVENEYLPLETTWVGKSNFSEAVTVSYPELQDRGNYIVEEVKDLWEEGYYPFPFSSREFDRLAIPTSKKIKETAKKWNDSI